jgi:hypothetical protein
MGQRTSVYLDDDLQAAVKATSGTPRRAHPPRPHYRTRTNATAGHAEISAPSSP